MTIPVADAAMADQLAAVAGVAAELGIGPIEPAILGVARHAIIHLAPLALVARLRAVDLAPGYDDLARELRVATHLEARDAPAIRPARSIDPGPHRYGGHVLTLWDHAPHRAATARDARPAARALARLHAGLADFDGALPPFTDAIDACGDLLAKSEALPYLGAADRGFLAALHVGWRAELGSLSVDSVPIHGDAHLGNALRTPAGILWADLEAACRGPREWDIACLPESARTAYGAFDRDLARRLADLRSLCVATWCWRDHGRSKRVDEAAAHHLGRLRARFGGR